ncbi:MAG: DUF5110 domain-containing protein [Chitinophagaceae bacterium]|nr:DUF5110 domain-containing protein [Chitinophagaceae bacterium]
MRTKWLPAIILFFCAFIFATNNTAAQQNYVKLNDGIIVKIKSPARSSVKMLKVQVVSDHILHITASPADSFFSDKSLMVVEIVRPAVNWDVKEADGLIVLSTKAVNVNISAVTGEISFTDKEGKIILQETKGGGKSFTGTTLDGEQSYIIRQAFAGDEKEALYGLGQHQAGVFNYKGTQVLLSQYNTEVAVPFMTSSKNYGILWDNNSITKSIDTREYEQLSTLKLFSKEGDQGWLTATYYDKKDPSKVVTTRPESLIDYSYIPSLRNLPDAVILEKVTVTWEGFIQSGFSGEHIFNIRSAGYAKIYIDGKLLANRWRQGWNPGTELIRINLEKGTKHSFKIEWDPTSGESFISCHWLKPLQGNEKNEFAFESEAGDQINYYFIKGNNIDEVISGYRELTGKATMMPKWAMGFWQSRERYKTQDEIINTVAEFRKRKIPIDNIVLDWSYWEEDKWGSHEFDKTRFPDAAGMIKTLHEKYKTQLMISVWAKFYEGIPNYKKLNDSGWIYKRNVANRQRDWIGKGYLSSFYDPYHPGARKMFWDMMNTSLFSKGIDAWWMDATEPDVTSNLSPQQRKEFSGPNYFGSSTKNFNAFSLVNAQGVYEGQRKADSSKRVFILTRSAYASLQRYAAVTWSGDIGSRWEDFKNQIPAGLNFSMSGMPYWTTDIGGFAVEPRYENAKGKDLDEWREQTTRWYQYGVFCPIFRVHGQFPYREIYNIAPDDHPAYKSMLYYNKLRYRLMPYIYSLVGKTYHDNYTIMRGLPMDFGTDEKVKNIADQFMFGPSILVNPVYEYEKRNREVYLPNANGWYDFYTGKFLEGGQTITADAPYETLPLYIKEGSIIPVGPELQYTSEKSADPITLFVYTGKDASFTLYEDENLNYNYEKGAFSQIVFSYDEGTGTLTISDRTGSFNGKLKNRTFKIVWISKEKPGVMNFESKTDKTVKYSGRKLVVTLK